MTAVAMKYYSFDKLFSYNATYMFAVGARGNGKTYGAKHKVIRDFIRNGNQFIYLRRYKTEIAGRHTFFADIADAFPDHDFRVNGLMAEMATSKTRGQKKRDWAVMGYFVTLANAQAQKSVAYPRVKTIIFDEFIIEKGALHYLPDEANVFNNFYSTVDRWKDKTRVLFLANSVSIMNPYFLEYDIKPDQEDEFVSRGDGFIVCHFIDAEEFAGAVFRTAFGRFIKGTSYADFAVAAEFSDNHDKMIAQKTSQATYYCTIETKAGIFSVWVNYSLLTYYIQEKRPKNEIVYTVLADRMDNGKLLLVYSDKIMQYLRAAFKGGKVYFDTPKARNAFIEIFRR